MRNAKETKSATMSDFKPGLYRHYKGGLYTAIGLVTHHGTREPMVLYVSLSRGGLNVRPLYPMEDDRDSWNDWVDGDGAKHVMANPLVSDEKPNWPGIRRRFEFVGELPSDTPADQR